MSVAAVYADSIPLSNAIKHPDSYSLIPVNTRKDNINDSQKWKDLSLGYSIYFGTGPRFNTGRLNEFFSWAWNFNIGADIWLGRMMAGVQFNCNAPTIRQSGIVTSSATDDDFMATVKTADYYCYSINIGYTALKAGPVSVTPYLSGNWSQYKWTSRPLVPSIDNPGSLTMGNPARSMDLRDFNIGGGLRISWRFNSFFIGGDTPNSSRQKISSCLEITPYAQRAVYSNANPSFSGWQIGVSVGYSAFVNTMKRIGD